MWTVTRSRVGVADDDRHNIVADGRVGVIKCCDASRYSIRLNVTRQVRYKGEVVYSVNDRLVFQAFRLGRRRRRVWIVILRFGKTILSL